MAKRSIKVLRALAKDDSGNVERKAKRKKSKERPLPPGTVLSWNEVWMMLKMQKMDPDGPMLIKLPKPLTFGQYADGSPRMATHVGFAIDDFDHLKTDLFAITENGILDLDITNIDHPRKEIPN